MTTDWLLRDIEPSESPAGADAHLLPAQAQAGAPLLLCLTLGASACGLLLLLYGRFYAASDIPTVIGVILQICAAALAMGFGLYLKNSVDAAQGAVFIRSFWRVNIWFIVLLPLRMIYFTLVQLVTLLPEPIVMGLWYNAQPIWKFGRAILFAGIPIALYAGVCLFVSLVLCRRPRKKD